MTITVSNKKYEAAAQALVKIACGRKPTPNGWATDLRHHEIKLIAREACDVLGLSYSTKHLPRGPKSDPIAARTPNPGRRHFGFSGDH